MRCLRTDDLQAAGRKRLPPANAPETWAKLRSISIKLNETLHDLLEIMHQPAPGERAPENATVSPPAARSRQILSSLGLRSAPRWSRQLPARHHRPR